MTKTSRRNSRRFYVAVVALFVVLALLVVGFIGTALTRPVQTTFDSLPDNAKAVSFNSESGSLLKGWIFDVPNARASAVLMHGVRSNRGELVSRANWLNELGVSVLVFDFQSHGESIGDGITLGYLESMDAIAAVDVVKNRYSDIPRLALGISLGGASAMLASPALEVDALVLESVYPDIETAIGNRIGARIPGGALLTPLLSWQIKPRAGVSASWLNPALRAQTIDAPALVLSGTEDTQTTVEDTHKLFNALAGVKQLHFFEGAAHVNLYRYDAQQYQKVVLAFLNTHLLYR